MSKRRAEAEEGNQDANSGYGVYYFIRDLIREGKYAWFVNKNGQFAIMWRPSVKLYHEYRAKKKPWLLTQFNQKKAKKALLGALLYHCTEDEGGVEYKECVKKNESGEVIERQFRMPPRIFQPLFGSDMELSDNSEHNTSGFGSESEENFAPTRSSSDAPCEERMDTCHEEQLQDSALDYKSSNSDDDVDPRLYVGVVQDVCPSYGPMKGGTPIQVNLMKKLPEDETSGEVEFVQVGVKKAWDKLNPYNLKVTTPAYEKPGPVVLKVYTDTRLLGEAIFVYVDEIKEALEQLIKNPALRSSYADTMQMLVKQIVKEPALQQSLFGMMSQEHGMIGNDSKIAQNLGSTIQAKHAQALNVLLELVYTSAEEDAQQFIQMIFSTSAGKIVFNSYKDRNPLPEDVARANGHDDLAEYLQDQNERLSKESSSDVQSITIDWLELVKAVDKVQAQSSIAEDERELNRMPSKDESDYFADVETSSCGSFEIGVRWSDSEDGEGTGAKDEESKKESSENSTYLLEPALVEASFREERQSDNALDENKSPDCHRECSVLISKPNWSRRFFQWLSRKKDDLSARQQEPRADQTEETKSFSQKIFQSEFGGESQKSKDTGSRQKKAMESPLQEKTTKPKKSKRQGRWNYFRRLKTPFQASSILFTIASVAVLTGFTLEESQILHWAVGNGCTQISKVLLKCGLYVDAPNFLMETPLHVAAKNGYKDLADVLTKLGSNVSARTYQENTPLHLAVWNGQQQIVKMLIQHGSDLKARDTSGRTPIHLAAVEGHQQIMTILIQHGSDVNAANNLGETPLHLAAGIGHKEIAELLIQHGNNLSARSKSHKTALHVAAQFGHKNMTELLIARGANASAREHRGKTPLHLAAENGHEDVVEFLIQHGGDVNAVDNFGETALHLAAGRGHEEFAELLIQHGSQFSVDFVAVLTCMTLSLVALLLLSYMYLVKGSQFIWKERTSKGGSHLREDRRLASSSPAISLIWSSFTLEPLPYSDSFECIKKKKMEDVWHIE